MRLMDLYPRGMSDPDLLLLAEIDPELADEIDAFHADLGDGIEIAELPADLAADLAAATERLHEEWLEACDREADYIARHYNGYHTDDCDL